MANESLQSIGKRSRCSNFLLLSAERGSGQVFTLHLTLERLKKESLSLFPPYFSLFSFIALASFQEMMVAGNFAGAVIRILSQKVTVMNRGRRRVKDSGEGSLPRSAFELKAPR